MMNSREFARVLATIGFAAFFQFGLSAPVWADAQVPGLAAKIVYCSTCHGKNGEGFNGYYYLPRLAGQTPEYIVNQLKSYADHDRDNPVGKKFMWPIAEGLSPEMQTALAAHYSQFKAPPAGGGETGQELIGKTVFEKGVPASQVLACNMCHGQNAEGLGPTPRLAGQGYLYIKRIFEDWQEGYRAHAAPMPDYAKALTEVEIEGLAQYLSTLP